jgi:hypothetical protein
VLRFKQMARRMGKTELTGLNRMEKTTIWNSGKWTQPTIANGKGAESEDRRERIEKEDGFGTQDSNDFDGAFRQGIEKGLPVAFAENAIVEHDDDAGVAPGANQTPDALAEFENGFGQ